MSKILVFFFNLQELYNLKNLDPIHKEALDNVTELLQAFMERQGKLRQMIKGKIPFQEYANVGDVKSEIAHNSIIINFIQWVRYFMWGNSPEEVGIKIKNINRWTWVASETTSSLAGEAGPVIFQWAKETLKIDDSQLTRYECLPYKAVVHQILDLCVPPRPGGLFGLMDGNYGSITLDNAIELMKKEMREL